MPKALVIGTGFVGTAVQLKLRAQGWDAAGSSLHGQASEFACDISQLASVEALAAAFPAPELVVHCASSPRGGGLAGYQAVYRDGCAHLARTFPKAHLIYTSSTSVYGQTQGEWVDESSPTCPVAATSEVLLEAEASILNAGGTVMRLAGLYGPGRSVILKKFLSGEAVIEEGAGRFLNQIHRDDAATALVHLATKPAKARGQIFNTADSKPLTQLDCYQGLASILQRSLPPEGPRDVNKKRGWTNKRVNNQKLLQSGWAPRFPSYLDAVPELLKSVNV